MCGITGFIGPFPPERIYAMNEIVAHRGPDDQGYWIDAKEGLALGHKRLSIIDLRPEGRQPIGNEDGSVQVVFNGEIYNFQGLRAELEQKGHRFRTLTDTETIVHLYEEEGIESVRRLNGIFALALWDATNRKLLLARDPIGVKPLYYCAFPNAIVFSSELKALLQFPEIPRELDYSTVHYHLSYIWAPSPNTMFRNVRKLEPGYRLVFADGRVVRHEPFYDVPYDGTRNNGSRSERVERLRSRLQDAVQRQMISDVPVGAFLSGGVDSSSILAMMRQHTAGMVRCYTIAFDESDAPDENMHDLPFARMVASHLGVDLREVHVRPDVAAFTERMVYLLDEPQADPACINVYLICRQAREDGYKVLMSGAGGDDIFSGYRRHTALFFERYWGWLPVAIRRTIAVIAHRIPPVNSLTRRLNKYFAYADRTAEERLMRYFLWITDDVLRSLYTPELQVELACRDTLQPLRDTLARIPSETHPLNLMLYLESKHFLPDHNLNYTDKMSMAHGVEVRVPLLDLELVDYAAHLPPNDKTRGLRSKAILKDAMRPYLPHAVLNRPKTGFGAPLRRWIRQDLREMVRDILSEECLKRRGLFDPAAVQRLISSNERLEIDASYIIFSLMCIEMWIRNFKDKQVLPADLL